MKRKNGKNIITSDDITVLGKNSGKTLEEVLEKLQDESNNLKSNVKWLYKYGGVGGNGGGESSTTTDKWTVVCSLGGVQIPESSSDQQEIRSILFSQSGNQKLYIHINNAGGDTYSVEYTYNGGKSKGSMILTATNRYTGEANINLQENGNIHVSVMNGDLLEKVFDAKHIVNAYSIFTDLVDNEGIKYPTTIENGVAKYNLFITDVKERGLRFNVKYNSAVNTPVTYIYSKFHSSQEIPKTTQFTEGQYQATLLDVEAFDELQSLTDDDAAQHIFKMRIIIGDKEIIQDVTADFLPDDLYLKISPTDPETVLYFDQNHPNPETQIIGNRSFTITPYNGKEGSAGKITCTYFINDEPVQDNTTSVISTDTVQSGKSFQRTFMFQSSGENKIVFRARLGDRYKDFTYYYHTVLPENTINWFDENIVPFSTASYRYGDSSQAEVKLRRNGTILNPSTYIVKNANDNMSEDIVVSNETTIAQEILINIGLQYNYINDESKEIIEIPTTNTSVDTNSIHIYQNKLQIGSSELQGIFFIEEEEKYNISDNSKYHLITIARKYIRTIGISNHQYEISVYIDGVLQANTVAHMAPSLYSSFKLYNGNYSINLLDISYFNNNSLNEANIVRYWYAYQTRVQSNFENVERKSNLLNIFNSFNIESGSNGLFNGHVSVSESTLRNLIQNITVPVLCIEYEPNANKDYMGNPMNFFTWSDTIYASDSHDAMTLTVGLKWSNGTGNYSTTLEDIDVSSILTPDGQQKSAKFTLDIQGSTTRTYKSKNYTLGIEFTDSDNSYIPIFTPWFNLDDTKTFLPENSFTLKADIVDSSHTNNTCMGKFINENTNQFQDAKQLNSIYSGHIKNCLEGFPCLIFVHSSGDLDYYFLGIYNFNLGRTSNFNLGYCDLRALPELRSSTSDVYEFNIYSVARTSTSQQIGSEIKQDLITAEIDGNEAWFDFSQYDESILFQLPNRPNDEGFMFSEIVSGRDINYTSQYTKSAISNFVKRASRSGGYIFDKIERGFHDNIESSYTTREGYVPNARIQYQRKKDDETQTFEVISSIVPGSAEDFNDQDLINFMFTHTENDVEGVAPYSNFRSIVEYYTICMAFGLLDSVQKNLNIKSWNDGKTFYLAFYDMDTCLGINNDGDNVSYYAFSDYWKSSQNNVIDHDVDDVPIVSTSPITVYRDHAPANTDASLYDVPSSYVFAVAKYAKSVIQYYNLITAESSFSLDSIPTPQDLWATWRSRNGSLQNATYFINTYYTGYMNGIDELMFNYNFKAKYFRESTEEVYDQESSRFRGRSIGYLKDWLNKRFHILDAYFNLIANKEVYISDGAEYSKTNKESQDYDPNYQIVYEQYPLNTLYYSDDVNINKSIFGENGSLSGDLDIIVQAPDYTPIITTVGRTIYRFLLEESSNKYNIQLRNTGTNKVIFGGSSMWTYINTINPFANGTFVLQSDKLQVLNGNSGNVNAWTLSMPALQDLHLNGTNYAGELTFDRNSTCYNLTNVDISSSQIKLTVDNQNVKTINLTNIKSGGVSILNCHLLNNIIFSNTQITNCTIQPVNYITAGGTMSLQNNNITNLILSTSNNLNLSINGDRSLKILQVEGFKTIVIKNCPNLETIVSSGSNLTSITTTICPKVKEISLNVTNCTTIDIANSVLSALILNTSTDYTKLVTLSIPQSKITGITYNKIVNGNLVEEYTTSLENAINLTPLVNLNSFNISSNPNIKYIIFPNDYNKPIPIRNSFSGCTLLERIYGCVNIVNTDNTFYGLTHFSIHGTLDDTWKGYSKTKVKNIDETDYSIVQTPLQLLTSEEFTDDYDTIIGKYNNITKQDLFQSGDIEEGNYVTNIFFASNISGSFTQFLYSTLATQFDVYYIFNSFGLSGVLTNNITIGNAAFYGQTNMFDYTNGNQFNRHMFYKCGKIVAFSASTPVFRTGNTLLYSPTVQNGNIVRDDGLFSPLKGLVAVSRFCSGGIYISRYIFRRKTASEKYNLQNFGWQGISFIHDDVDQYELSSQIPPTYTAATGGAIVEGHENKLGNLTDIFKQTNIKTISNTFNMPVINYSTLVFPNTITSIYASFQNSYGFGTFNWKNTFDSTLNYNGLTQICNSFILGNYLGSTYVEFKIYEDMFNNMTNLQYLGAQSADTGSNGGYTNNAPSVDVPTFSYGLRGYGFSKVLDNDTFPYNIASHLTNIINFVGVFCELYNKVNIPSIVIQFPDNMFSNCTKLQNISALFADNRVKIELTPNGFINCKNLTSVSRLFYTSVSAAQDSNINRIIQNTSIPHRFFYLGETEASKTYYGTNSQQVMEDDKAYMEDNETGAEFVQDSNSTATVTYKNPVKNIQYATECFFGQDQIKYYQWDKTDFDITNYPNPEYIPFTYYKKDGVWYTRPDDPKYTKQYDISSIYDGDYGKLEANAYCEDSDNVQGYTETTQKAKNIVNYFCPPDLLNSFLNSTNLNINGMFRWCGEGSGDALGPRTRPADLSAIMSGRICPYLFNTVNNIMYLTEFFENCKGISSYKIGQKFYMIPPKLFEKTTNLSRLAKTFSGMYFDTAPNFEFLTRLTSQRLDIRGIFSMCYYRDSWVISNIFSSNTLSQVSGAFCARVVTLINDTSNQFKISVSTALNNIRQEVPPCIFRDNITTSLNATKQIIRNSTGYVYYKVGNEKVTENDSILLLDENHNLHD